MNFQSNQSNLSSPAVQLELRQLLADTQVLTQKLRSFHWNVTGRNFFGLHAKFEELYDTFAERVDALAERLATLGERPLSTLAEALGLTRFEEDGGVEGGEAMVATLLADFERLGAFERAAAILAGEGRDVGTQALLDGFADADEKEAWMLRATLGPVTV